jgi:hypothetical protein
MRLLILAIFFYFVSTSLVESFIISALIGFKIGYALASRLVHTPLPPPPPFREPV